ARERCARQGGRPVSGWEGAGCVCPGPRRLRPLAPCPGGPPSRRPRGPLPPPLARLWGRPPRPHGRSRRFRRSPAVRLERVRLPHRRRRPPGRFEKCTSALIPFLSDIAAATCGRPGHHNSGCSRFYVERRIYCRIMRRTRSSQPAADAATRRHHVLGAASRARILEVLRATPGGLDARQTAIQVGLHHNTVRSHLELLAQAGLATKRAEERSAPGRPRVVFEAT